jgi:hypothetical protein
MKKLKDFNHTPKKSEKVNALIANHRADQRTTYIKTFS